MVQVNSRWKNPESSSIDAQRYHYYSPIFDQSTIPRRRCGLFYSYIKQKITIDSVLAHGRIYIFHIQDIRKSSRSRCLDSLCKSNRFVVCFHLHIHHGIVYLYLTTPSRFDRVSFNSPICFDSNKSSTILLIIFDNQFRSTVHPRAQGRLYISELQSESLLPSKPITSSHLKGFHPLQNSITKIYMLMTILYIVIGHENNLLKIKQI